MFADHVKDIKANLENVASHVGDITREVSVLEERAKAAGPAAQEYERLKKSISDKTIEYAELSKRYAELEKAYRDYQAIASRK